MMDTLRRTDGTALSTRSWLPQRKPTAVVILVHGYAEHSGRYESHAFQLCQRDVAVEAIDLRGHGLSDGPRGYLASWVTLVDDVITFIGDVSDRHHGTPAVLFGHSFGATIAGLASLEAPHELLRGLIMSSPALRINEPPWLQQIGLLLARLWPRLPTKRLDRRKLSADAAYVAASNKDPLNFHGRIATGTAAQIVIAGREMRHRAVELTRPLLIIHGTEDEVTMPEASADLYDHAPSDDKSLNLYPGLRHETLNEPNGHVVLDRIADFIIDHAH